MAETLDKLTLTPNESVRESLREELKEWRWQRTRAARFEVDDITPFYDQYKIEILEALLNRGEIVVQEFLLELKKREEVVIDDYHNAVQYVTEVIRSGTDYWDDLFDGS